MQFWTDEAKAEPGSAGFRKEFCLRQGVCGLMKDAELDHEIANGTSLVRDAAPA